MQPTITPLGDSAVTITFGVVIDEQINQKVLSLFRHLQQQNIYGVKDIIPAYASLTIVYDITKMRKVAEGSAYTCMYDLLEKAMQNTATQIFKERAILHVPVCYDASFGTDLINMSEQKAISIEEIVSAHSSVTYRVYMTGFLPGFAYMGKVDDKIATPRKAVPNKNVPAGSVGIADAQTGIYPFNSPGGWNIIGRTPLQIFNAHAHQPCLLQPGNKVKFEPITLERFHQLDQR